MGGVGEASPLKTPSFPPKGEKEGKRERREKERERGGGGRGTCILFRHGTSDQYSSLLHDLII